MIKPKFVIPSFRRSKTIASRTIALLSRYGISGEDVFIFLSDWAEREEYAKALPKEFRNSLYRGAPKLIPNRWEAIKHFSEGEHIVSMDDDLQALQTVISKKEARDITPAEFNDFVERGFSACEQSGARLWCVYPVNNPYFMQKKIRSGFFYAVGAFYGFINEHDPALSPEAEYKEDFERTILYYIKYGAIVRLDYICLKTNYWGEAGGLQADGKRTSLAQDSAVKYLINKYPDWCCINTAKRDRLEIKLKDQVMR